jgi:hypothetical protein
MPEVEVAPRQIISMAGALTTEPSTKGKYNSHDLLDHSDHDRSIHNSIDDGDRELSVGIRDIDRSSL